jgi:XTP/dITP diphosphohydrolase
LRRQPSIGIFGQQERDKAVEISEPKPVFVRQLLVASNNPHKARELQTVGRKFGMELLSPKQLVNEKGFGPPPVVDEDADDYRGNALIKAKAFALWSGYPALGDDSGLEVMGLGGRPGVHSARYAGDGASDQVRIAKLLDEFKRASVNNPSIDRTAFFRCSLVLAYPNGAQLVADASLQGRILDTPRGNEGFGYDPIILIEDLGKTLAEVDFEITCEKGFRAKAAKLLFEKLLSLQA